jgi:ribonuclease P protein component
MLQKENRLVGRDCIEKVKAEGVLWRGRGFSARSLKSKGKVRIGFVVSKRISKSAVERNKTRRKLREAVRKYLKDRENIGGGDILIFASGQVIEMTGEQLEREVGKCFESIFGR